MTASTSWPRLTSAGQPGNNPKTFMKIQTGIVIAAILAFGVTLRAEIVEKKSLDLAGAKKAIAAAVDYAKKNNAPGGVIAVVDEGGNLMALERLDGTFAMGATISVGKARTAVLFKKPTRFFEELINKGRTAMTAVDGFTPLIGGIPIVVDGQVVGGIGVSGAASAVQDEELALAGANALMGRQAKIEGGQEHQITKGEVIIIPNGVPHQFTAVSGELHYFVCKPTAVAARGQLSQR